MSRNRPTRADLTVRLLEKGNPEIFSNAKIKNPEFSKEYLQRIVAEYELIQAKKSKLSRKQRELVLQQVDHLVEKNLLRWDSQVPTVQQDEEE